MENNNITAEVSDRKIDIIYSEETKVSLLTNRVVNTNHEEDAECEFYCRLCNVNNSSARSALQHYFSRSHMANSGLDIVPSVRDRRKRNSQNISADYNQQQTNQQVSNQWQNASSRQPYPSNQYKNSTPHFLPSTKQRHPSLNQRQPPTNQRYPSTNQHERPSNASANHRQSFAHYSEQIPNKRIRPNAVSTSQHLSNQHIFTLSCEKCGLKFNSQISADQHFSSKKHMFATLNGGSMQSSSKPLLGPNKGPGFTKSGSSFTKSGPSLTKSGPSFTKSEDDGPTETFYCKICDNTFNSQISADQHYNGKKHKLAVAENAVNNGTTVSKVPAIAKYHCTYCDIGLNSDEQMTQHCNGIRHKLNAGEIKEPPAWWSEQQEEYRSSRDKRTTGRGISNPYECTTCSILLNSDVQLADHIRSKRHIENQRRVTEGGNLPLLDREGTNRWRSQQKKEENDGANKSFKSEGRGGSNNMRLGRGTSTKAGRGSKRGGGKFGEPTMKHKNIAGQSRQQDETSPNFMPMTFSRIKGISLSNGDANNFAANQPASSYSFSNSAQTSDKVYDDYYL